MLSNFYTDRAISWVFDLCLFNRSRKTTWVEIEFETPNQTRNTAKCFARHFNDSNALYFTISKCWICGPHISKILKLHDCLNCTYSEKSTTAQIFVLLFRLRSLKFEIRKKIYRTSSELIIIMIKLLKAIYFSHSSIPITIPVFNFVLFYNVWHFSMTIKKLISHRIRFWE